METLDLYSDYVGELSIVLQEKNSNQTIVLKVILLEFHFNKILSLISLGQYHNESVMYNYFRCEGWHDDEWECKRLQEFIEQLNTINYSVQVDLQNVYNEIKKKCK